MASTSKLPTTSLANAAAAALTDPGGSMADALDARIVELLGQCPDGLSNAQLLQELTALPDQQGQQAAPSTAELSAVVNRLLSDGRVEMLRQMEPQPGGRADAGGGFVLRLKKGSQLANASPEEQLVFSIIEESQRMGVWIRDIRERSGLNELQLRRILKGMEQKKLVRSIKAAGTTRKTYILAGLEADESLTGGTFYSDQQLDSEFVQTLIHVCVSWLLQRRRHAEEQNPADPVTQREAAFVESEEVAHYIHDKGICRVQLGLADVESVLDIAVLDGKLEKRLNHTYRALRPRRRVTPLASLPCLQCPMNAECTPGHLISPENCEYFRNYFEL